MNRAASWTGTGLLVGTALVKLWFNRSCSSCAKSSTQWVRLDTGCATALQWVTSEVEKEQCPHRTAIGQAAVSIPQTKTTVSIGNQSFQKAPTGLHETTIFPGEAELLGNGLLSRFSAITIDTRAGRVFLVKQR